LKEQNLLYTAIRRNNFHRFHTLSKTFLHFATNYIYTSNIWLRRNRVTRINFTYTRDRYVSLVDRQRWAMISRSFSLTICKIIVISMRPFHPEKEIRDYANTREVAVQPTAASATVWKQVCQSGCAVREFSRTELAPWFTLSMGVGFSSMVECLEWNDPQFVDLSHPVIARMNRETSGTLRYSHLNVEKKRRKKNVRKKNNEDQFFSYLWTVVIFVLNIEKQFILANNYLFKVILCNFRFSDLDNSFAFFWSYTSF